MKQYTFEDNLIALIRDGKKTATCIFKSVLNDEEVCELHNMKDDLVEIINTEGKSECRIQITRTCEVPLRDIPEWLAIGEGFDSIDEWVEDSYIFWDEVGGGKPYPADDLMVVQQFQCIELCD